MSSTTAEAHLGLASAGFRRRFFYVAAGAVGVVVLGYAVGAFVRIDTSLLWFRAVGHESVYTRTFWTQALLFTIFGALMAAAVANTLVVFHRDRPAYSADPVRERWRYRFNRVEPRLRRWLFVAIVGYLAVSMGARAAGNWQTWLQWRHAVSFGQQDPQFHRDVSYFVFVYPLHRLVLTLLFRIVATALVLLLIAAFAYGGLRLRGPGPRMTRSVQRQLSLLLAIYLILKAFAYWLDRYALVTSNRGIVTGLAYTDTHAVLPGRIVLMVLALIAAGMLIANVVLCRPALIWRALVVMAGGALLVGVAWPAVIQQFREKPSASAVELPAIRHNIAATRSAFGLSNVTLTPYPATQTLHGAALAAQLARNAQIRVLDPNKVSPTFNVRQQVQSYYGFKSTLDIDRYPIGGHSQDVALAVRELTLSGLPAGRQSWTNTHLVFTHGYGVAAATTTSLPGGLPNFVEGNLPPAGQIPVAQPRIYYGQMSPSYSIVGGPASTSKEFDLPDATGTGRTARYSHTGGGGVPIGSWFHRLLYAWQLRSPSVLLSSEINADSQLLTVRNPRARVAAIAPWLTLDGDTYPSVVNGHIVWVVDGYTTSNSYPDSQQINLRNATSSTLSQNGATVTQAGTSINYMHNSVKATVDAYSGAVTLYAWNQAAAPDPILASWEKSFPGLVKPQSEIPPALLPHLRYPQDLFNVQRSLLTRYHVTAASQFYSGSNFWRIPTDPTIAASSSINAIGKKVTTAAPTQASTYMSLSPDGLSPARFALSSPMVTLNRRNLSGFLSVDSVPGPSYGRFTLLALPSTRSEESPSQIQNDVESDPTVAQKLTLLRGGNSKVVLGNLLAMPLGGQILYVEPIYTRAASGTSFPTLQRVIAVYGTGKPAFKRTLPAALDQALGLAAAPTTPAAPAKGSGP